MCAARFRVKKTIHLCHHTKLSLFFKIVVSPQKTLSLFQMIVSDTQKNKILIVTPKVCSLQPHTVWSEARLHLSTIRTLCKHIPTA